MHKFVTYVFLALFIVYFAASKLFFAVLFAFIPSADLPRATDGSFLVTLDNYDNWTTYARIWESETKTAYSDGLIMRSLPSVESTCDGIVNCDNYESEFKKGFFDVNRNSPVILINATDDLAVTSYIEEVFNAITEHNNTVMDNGFDFESSFQWPKLDGVKFFDVSYHIEKPYNQPIRKIGSWRSASRAVEMCRKNGSGCEVGARVEYDIWGLNFTEVYIIEPD